MKFLFHMAVLCFSTASAQPFLSHLTSAVTLDGLSDEPAWVIIDPLPLVMYDPVYRGRPTEDSEIRVAYDETHLYVAGRFYDRLPEGIRANSLYRDVESGDDVFGILIDAFNDHESGLYFWTTPAGIRGDAAISDDGASTNESWNTHWDSTHAFIQYNSTDRRGGFNIRFRWNFREGNDLWIVYNEGFDHLSLVSRTVLVKYTHTLAL